MANNQKKDKNKKDFTNPATRPWGKILVGFLSISFVLATIALVIYFIVTSITTV